MRLRICLLAIVAVLASQASAVAARRDVEHRKLEYLVHWADAWKESGYTMTPDAREWKWNEYDPTWYGAIAAMTLKRSPGEIAKACEYFARMTEGATMRGAEAIHTLYLFKDDPDLSEPARKRLWQIAVDTPAPKRIRSSPWDHGTTENIAIMGHAWFLLQAQLKGDKAGAAEMEDLLCRFIDEHFRMGWVEFYSPCYMEKDAGALMMLVQWAQSPRVRRKARALLDLMFAEYAANDFDQVMAAPCMRAYGYNVITADEELGHNEHRDFSCSGLYSMGYVLFGQGRMVDYGVLGTPVLVTTDYVPPQIVLDIAAADRGTYEFRACKAGLNTVRLTTSERSPKPPYSARVYCYHTPDFVLGSTQEVNYVHSALRYNPVNSILFFRGDPRKVIFSELTLENGRDNWPVSMDVVQNGGVVVGRGTVGETYLARDLFDEVVEENGWIFVRDGGVFAGYRVVDGGYDWRHVKSPSVYGDYIEFRRKDSPFILHVCRAADYGGDFAAFRRQLTANKIEKTCCGGVRYTVSGPGGFSLELRPGRTAPKGKKIDLNDYAGKPPLLNGRELDLDDYPGIGCPFVHQAPLSRYAEITLGSERLRLGVGP